MSRDIFVQDIPDGVASVADIPDDWQPQPLPFRWREVREAVLGLVPTADFPEGGWGRVILPGAEIEINVGGASPLKSFALHVRGSDHAAADQFVAALLQRLGVRAFDPEGAPNTGLFGNR